MHDRYISRTQSHAIEKKDLEGVRLIVSQRLDLGLDGSYMPGEDITEKAKHWGTLPRMIARKMITAEPAVDWTSLDIENKHVPIEGAAVPSAQVVQGKELRQGAPAKQGRWGKKSQP